MCFGRKSIYYCVIRVLCKNGKYIIPIICWLKFLPNFECIQIHKDILAARCGYDLTHHHHALADAEACAKIALEIL